ncbi:hypothetical protein N7530_008811 [Penicillium desertorum]|uniref:Gfo/Idh/MocA-like oxidoreductase N-terminal domain-containing protein n=1 Tax=Penicillium desertorum TaxID=1303715 RepID=A0A9W9WPX0_9EURO|nr:hypothetical protein N7530_008811 [Penicillium desertorum]
MNKLRSILTSKPPTGTPAEQTKSYQPRPNLTRTLPPQTPAYSNNPPRLILIGGGSRGQALARAIVHGSNGHLIAIAEPDPIRRRQIGRHCIWGIEEPSEGEEFEGWRQFLEWELARQAGAAAAPIDETGTSKVIDAAVICTPDHTHREIVLTLAPLGIHLMCEKPLATSLQDLFDIYSFLGSKQDIALPSASVSAGILFAVGHGMRYTPHNQLLRKLVREDEIIGDVVSVEHTENVGWWHFCHSYVRGNWRKEKTSGPSLLTKSCHDIDFLLWLLAEPNLPRLGEERAPVHLPSSVSSSGLLKFFRQKRKPRSAGNATNCLSCPAEQDCHFSAHKIYWERGVCMGLGGWPADVVLPDIEDLLDSGGLQAVKEKLDTKLMEDYTSSTSEKEVSSRQWYGRCVFQSDNDVCDDQTVHISWDDDEGNDFYAKSVTFHMTAFTEGVCTKQMRIFGTKGEISTDGALVTVRDFVTGETKSITPPMSTGGHSGGDYGLMRQFVLAVDAVKNHGLELERAQIEFIGCTMEDIIRSHSLVFAAEEARKLGAQVDWEEWWKSNFRK